MWAPAVVNVELCRTVQAYLFGVAELGGVAACSDEICEDGRTSGDGDAALAVADGC